MNTREKQHAIRLVRNFLILVVLFFITDRLLGLLIGKYYQKADHGDIATFTHSITDPTEDIFIYGSSRALHGYSCPVLAATTGLTALNNGRENSTILYHSLVLNEMLKKHRPRIILLDLAPKELSWGATESSRGVLANTLLPYAINDTAIARLAHEQFPKEYVKARLSWLYAYRSAIIPLINWKRSKQEESINGYRPLSGSKVKATPLDYGNETETPDSTAKKAFEAFVQATVASGVKLYVIHSPIFVKRYASTPSIDYAKEVLDKYGVSFWNYSFDTAFYKPSLFYDYIHLNDSGATLFSRALGERIREELTTVAGH